MTVTSKQEAWNKVNEIFPTDYEQDMGSSDRAGYSIYRSTAEGHYYDYICDLGNRLEVNLDSSRQGHPDEIITRTVDLTALNGSTEYGTCEAKVAPLTLDELRKYHGIIPKPEVWEWSATPWSTPAVNEDDTWVLGLYTDGNLSGHNCSYTGGSRPAFLIPSSLIVEVDGDEAPEASNPLEQYDTKELVQELFRRVNV